ncbi:MAG: hypothetical protein FWG87_01005, partial [Defluviitaleaceae bacterium]|nr:hypothetical protein [Defluviitaleaceae bacterium]
DGQEIEIRFRPIDGEERPYIYAYSNPTMVDSDGDGIPDNLDPEPLKPHDDRFIIVTDPNYRPPNSEVDQSEKESNESHGNKTPDELDSLATSELKEFEKNAQTNVIGGALLALPNAKRGMAHFLSNTGETLSVSIRNLLNTQNGETHFHRNMDFFLNAAEQMVMDGGATIIATVDPGPSPTNNRFWASGYTPSGIIMENGGTIQVKWPPDPVLWFGAVSDYDWKYFVGNSTSSIVGTVRRNGDDFFATISYYLDDQYNWKLQFDDGGGLAKDGEMRELHLHGRAREYRVDGSVHEIEITWSKGQRFTSENEPEVTLP